MGIKGVDNNHPKDHQQDNIPNQGNGFWWSLPRLHSAFPAWGVGQKGACGNAFEGNSIEYLKGTCGLGNALRGYHCYID